MARPRTSSGSQTSTWVSVGQQLDQQLHPVDQGRRQRLHPVDGMALGDLVEHLDQLGMLARPARTPAARTSSVSSSSRQGEAMIVGQRSRRWSAGRRPRSSGSPRPCRRRSRSGPGAPRSAGTRRRCRRGRRTRRAARPGRPGRTPRRPGRAASSSRSKSSPTASRTGRRSPSPLTCGCSTLRTGATMIRGGGSLVVAGQPAQHGQPAADGVRARAQPLVRQRLPGRVVGDRRPRPSRRLQGRGQLLGLAVGGGDQQHRAAGAAAVGGRGQRRGDQRPHRRRRGQIEGADGTRARVTDGLGNGGFGAEEIDESRKGHRNNLQLLADNQSTSSLGAIRNLNGSVTTSGSAPVARTGSP